MASDIMVKKPDEAERLEALKVFLRSFRSTGESREAGLDHFINMLEGAGLAHVRAAVDSKGKVVGSGGLICFKTTAWIALMGVEPGLQRQGIGDAIMTELMNLAIDLGFKTVKLDATNFGQGLYARHGFTDEYPVHMYEIPASCDLGMQGGPRVRLDEEVPEWCLAMDRAASGDDRSALFSAALADGAKVLMVEGQGFGIMHGRKIGPIIAKNIDVAIAIVRRADSFGVNRIYVPHHPELSEGFLVGLKRIPPEWELECCTRMIKGEPLKQNLKLEYAGYTAATG
jgi:GNAT superfamily N-acetyltransferase